MKPRAASIELEWNGSRGSVSMDDSSTVVTYTDPASGESDSIDISIHDRDGLWLTSQMPAAGDTLAAKLKLKDWTDAGDDRTLYCGTFTLDSFTFNGWPVTGSISGVSVPADGDFRETRRSKVWNGVTIFEIATEISRRAGIALMWDAKGFDFTITAIEQQDRTDCDFLMQVCTTYGLSMKVYARKLVIFDREEYKARPSVPTPLRPDDIENWSWQTVLAGTYTGGEFAYTDPRTEEDITARIGSGPRILKTSGKADSIADAERKLRAAVANANHGSTSLSLTVTGNASLFAGQCVTVSGLGKASGKYYIDKVTHSLGNGYTMGLELALVE